MNSARHQGRAVLRVLCLTSALAAVASPVAARDLPTIDRLGDTPVVGIPDRISAQMSPAAGGNAGAIQTHSRLGVPTFLWGQQVPVVAQVTATANINSRTDAVVAARQYLTGLGALYSLSPAQANAAAVVNTQDLPNGATLVKFRNRVDGIEVFREEAGVLVGPDRQLVAIGGFLMDRTTYAPYKLGATDAAAKALGDWSFAPATAQRFVYGGGDGDYQSFTLPADVKGSDGSSLNGAVRAKRVFFRLPSGLVPAYYVEVQVKDGSAVPSPDGVVEIGHPVAANDYYAYVVAGTDGAVLWRTNLTVDATYRVYAEPTGSFLPYPGPTGRNGFPHPTGTPDGYLPPFVPSNLVTLSNLPFSRNDPWLAPNATITAGNNVEAFADLYGPDNITPLDPNECNAALPPTGGDFHACATAPGVFDYTYDTTKAPNLAKAQSMAAVTNLFYMNNWLHDWYYDSGFDEAAGNAQNDNFGRGGLGNDSIFAEGQDFAGLWNANMATPADGARPRMRMFTFYEDVLMQVNAPAAIAGSYYIFTELGVAQFAQMAFDVTADVAYASPTNGCTAISGVAGKIAFIDRGTCAFTTKIKNAQLAGAVGVILANSSGGSSTFIATGYDPTITIGTLYTSQTVGNLIRNQLANGVNVRIQNRVYRDGTLDNGIIAHEWAHYLSNRLVANGGGLTQNQSRGMGEGWSDFNAMLLLVKDADLKNPANAGFNGAYPVGAPTLAAPWLAGQNQQGYYGIRRYPYSRDLGKNPLTFKHIAEGVALPTSPPPFFGQSGIGNSEVHNTGEVWTSMLWECYSNLLLDTPRLTFAQAQDRMKRYLVAGLKLTPPEPTFVEARDALLATMAAQDSNDYVKCYQGFAKRGAGLGAVAPDRYSSTNGGVVESFIAGGALAVASVAIQAPTGLKCTDGDAILDNNEGGMLVITFRNVGVTTLPALRGAASTSNPHLEFKSGPNFIVPASSPGQTVTASLPIRLLNAAGIEYSDVSVLVSDASLASGTASGTQSFLLNADDKPNASATDDVESPNSKWTAGSSLPPNAAWNWRRITLAANDHRWLGPDAGASLMTWLQSPPLNVAATGNFSFTFKHRHAFESDPSFAYDGGQIHISVDGGASWINIGASASPTYNGTMVNYSGNNNPFRAQQGYVRTNASYPNLDLVTVSLGAAYQGQTVLVRFAIGTDFSGNAPGWEIDDIAFSNITNTPFNAIAPNAFVMPASCPAP